MPQIIREDDNNWPAPDRVGKQELEIKLKGEHICFNTTKLGSVMQVQQSKDPDGLRIFYYLVQVSRQRPRARRAVAAGMRAHACRERASSAASAHATFGQSSTLMAFTAACGCPGFDSCAMRVQQLTPQPGHDHAVVCTWCMHVSSAAGARRPRRRRCLDLPCRT